MQAFETLDYFIHLTVHEVRSPDRKGYLYGWCYCTLGWHHLFLVDSIFDSSRPLYRNHVLFLDVLKKSMLGRLPVFCLIMLVGLTSQTAVAQLTSEVKDSLGKLVDDAKSELDSSKLPDAVSAKAEMLEKIDEVNSYFDQHTSDDNRDAWLGYLELESLEEALAQEGLGSELAREATALRDRLIGTTPGLELTVLQELRQTVQALISAIRFKDRDNAIKMLDAQLSVLAKLVESADEIPTPDQFSAISLRVDLLASARQSSELIEGFRQVFGLPNIAVRVSGDFLDQVVGREVSRTEPVKDVILGTSLTGTAVMTGNVSAKLIPSETTAQVEVNLTGTVDTKNNGVNGPVRLKSVSEGKVSLTRLLTINENGVDFGETESDVSITTKITDMTAKSDLALRVGKKQSAKKKPEADRIAKEKLRRRVTEQFEAEMDGLRENASSKLLSKAEPVLKRLSLTPPQQNWSTSQDLLSAEITFRSSAQLSAVNAPTAFESGYLFSAQVHESVVENAFSIILAGRTLNKDRLNELLENAGAPQSEVPDEDEESSFEISFSRSRPVIFESRGNKLRVGLRGTRFAQGDRAPLNKAMEITANYEVVLGQAKNPVLKRVGDVDVDFPRERLSIRDAGLKPIIQKEFAKIFPELILDQSIKIAEDAELETLRGREFRGSEIHLKSGWLSIAFQ